MRLGDLVNALSELPPQFKVELLDIDVEPTSGETVKDIYELNYQILDGVVRFKAGKFMRSEYPHDK